MTLKFLPVPNGYWLFSSQHLYLALDAVFSSGCLRRLLFARDTFPLLRLNGNAPGQVCTLQATSHLRGSSGLTASVAFVVPGCTRTRLQDSSQRPSISVSAPPAARVSPPQAVACVSFCIPQTSDTSQIQLSIHYMKTRIGLIFWEKRTASGGFMSFRLYIRISPPSNFVVAQFTNCCLPFRIKLEVYKSHYLSAFLVRNNGVYIKFT
jgi:hypothetical protein